MVTSASPYQAANRREPKQRIETITQAQNYKINTPEIPYRIRL